MINNPFALQKHIDLLFSSLTPIESAPQAIAEEELAGPIKTELQKLLGLANRQPDHLIVKVEKVYHQPTYHEEHVTLNIGEQVQIPIVVLVPKRQPPFKPILVFHGHEPGADYVLGHYPDEETAQVNLAIDNNYAQALAEVGYLVCVVEQRGLGRRLTDQVEDKGYPSSCRHLAFSYLMLGRTLVGERCWDGMAALDYLQTRSDVVSGQMGCTGHSGGGCTALWLSLLDERITAVTISGYFNSFADSILAMRHCECNYVPSLLSLGEMGDLAAWMAPRPFCVIHGQQDAIFPIEAAQTQFETVLNSYTQHGSADACHLHAHEGGHAYDISASLTWFGRWLPLEQ